MDLARREQSPRLMDRRHAGSDHGERYGAQRDAPPPDRIYTLSQESQLMNSRGKAMGVAKDFPQAQILPTISSSTTTTVSQRKNPRLRQQYNSASQLSQKKRRKPTDREGLSITAYVPASASEAEKEAKKRAARTKRFEKKSTKPAPGYPLKAFKLFRKLPAEIRCRIAQIALQEENKHRRLVVNMGLSSGWHVSELLSSDSELQHWIFFDASERDAWFDATSVIHDRADRALDVNLWHVNREFRGEVLRTYRYVLPMDPLTPGEEKDVPIRHLGKNDSLIIRNVEEALGMWNMADPSSLNANPLAQFDPSTRGNIHGEWAFKGIQSLTLPSSVLHFLCGELHFSKFLYDLPALKQLELLLQVNSNRDYKGDLINERADGEPHIIIAESEPITRDFVCVLEHKRHRESRISKNLIHMLTGMDRDRLQIEQYLTVRSGFEFKVPRMVLFGFSNWHGELYHYRE